jgi:hypothetical protein
MYPQDLSPLYLIDLKSQIINHIGAVNQDETGKDIDRLINDIAKTKFEHIAKENEIDKFDKRRIAKIKFGFSLAAVSLAVTAVIGAIATIIFSSGVLTPGAITLSVVTGFVGISTSFNQLDQAIYRYINFHNDKKAKNMRIKKLMNKINDVKRLLTVRINTIGFIGECDLKVSQGSNILTQIKRVNEFVRLIKEKVPEKITSFPVFDPSPLLKCTYE